MGGPSSGSVAIDGHVASGKSVTGHELAKRLRYLYLDTGAMYRAVAYLALHNGVGIDQEGALVHLLDDHRVDVAMDESTPLGYVVRVDGVDSTDDLFDPEVTSAVSAVASLPAIRRALVERQREIAREGPVVMAGRDIGTVVLPDARYKFFLTASLDERARRRQLEFEERGVHARLEEVRAQIQERDRLDETRATSPLRRAPDAMLIDSTGISAEQVVERMLAAIRSAA
ncbi:MAG: (d)CMP kinase [Candidatus Eremiobacteraeota bacterium]|nr:(d)CMP kinase [Candidatus Eremiobacteraeota bacterium]